MPYQQAVKLGSLRRHSGFASMAERARGLSDDTVVYVHDDLSVHSAPFVTNAPLFSDPSRDWLSFCEDVLGGAPGLFKLHPLNQHFEWRDTPGPFRMLSHEQARSYDELGYTKVDGVFSRKELDAVLVDMDECEARVESSLRRLKQGESFIARPDEITFAAHLVKRSPTIRAFVKSRPFQDLAHDLVGPDVRLYWDQTVYKKPGVVEPFPWHQDNGYTFVQPQQYPTIWIALTDADEENGCVWVVPRVHRLGTMVHQRTPLGYLCFQGEPTNVVPIPARAGDVVLFSSLTPHVTGGNFTDQTRKAYILQFVPDGAYSVTVDDDGKHGRVEVTLEERQFHVLRNGRAPEEHGAQA